MIKVYSLEQLKNISEMYSFFFAEKRFEAIKAKARVDNFTLSQLETIFTPSMEIEVREVEDYLNKIIDQMAIHTKTKDEVFYKSVIDELIKDATIRRIYFQML